MGFILLCLCICFICQISLPKPFCHGLQKYPEVSADLQIINQSSFRGKHWLCVLTYSEVTNQMQLQNSSSPNNKTSVFILCLMKQLSGIYRYLIKWRQIDELKLLTVSWLCKSFVAYSSVGSFLFPFCYFSHSPFLLRRNSLLFQPFHFTNWSLKCLIIALNENNIENNDDNNSEIISF